MPQTKTGFRIPTGHFDYFPENLKIIHPMCLFCGIFWKQIWWIFSNFCDKNNENDQKLKGPLGICVPEKSGKNPKIDIEVKKCDACPDTED